MHSKNIHTAGVPLAEAEKAIILIHGRGASASDILQLGNHLNLDKFALLAPQATHSSWYPKSFLAPRGENEPGLSSALETVEDLVFEIQRSGIAADKIYFAGFSQGACLTLDFVARNPNRYGGVAAFTGGLIGNEIIGSDYKGDFNMTPIFIGTGNPDSHVPLNRVEKTAAILQGLNADVMVKVYDGRAHTISQDEIEWANRHIFI